MGLIPPAALERLDDELPLHVLQVDSFGRQPERRRHGAPRQRVEVLDAEYVAMYWPRLERGAAKYSPTTAPIVARVTARRSDVKI